MVLKTVLEHIEKEGGAAGLGAIEKACKKAGSEDNVKDVMSKCPM